jgi:hypothetical protein
MDELIVEPDEKWLMIRVIHVNAHPHAAGSKGGNQRIGLTYRGLNIKIKLGHLMRGMMFRAAVSVLLI